MSQDSQPKREISVEEFAAMKLGRNDPCLCGSGKKLKRCCTHLLQMRHQVVQRRINMDVAYAAHCRKAAIPISKTAFIEQVLENEAKAAK